MTKTRSSLVRRTGGAIVLGTVAIAVSACSYTGGGGGWLPGAHGGRATIGFMGSCAFTHEGYGSLSYIDRSTDPVVSFEATSGTCSGTTATATLVGEYRPRPRGEAGTATIVLHDTGDRGPSKGDTVTVTLSGGAFDGYTNTGPLRGNLDLDQ